MPTRPKKPTSLTQEHHEELLNEGPDEARLIQVSADLDDYKQEVRQYKEAKRLRQGCIDLLIWYWEEWLPAVAGVEFWGVNTRLEKLPVDKILLGEKKIVLINGATEGFGLLQYENSRDRWLQTFEWKDHNKGKRPPQYNRKKPETHIFKSKWSDDQQGKGSGWANEAYEVFVRRQNEIKAFRAEEAKNGNPRMKFARKLVCEKNNVGVDATPKPRRAVPPLDQAKEDQREVVDMFVMDDDDDEEEDILANVSNVFKC